MNLSYFLLGSSGSIYTDIDGTLDLAFNDNFYVDNSGYFNFNLFSGDALVGTKQVLGNYSDWQTAFNLPANANYTYSADGYVFNDYTSAFTGSGVSTFISSTGSGVVPSWVSTGFLSGRQIFVGTGLKNPFTEYSYITLRSGQATSGLNLTRFNNSGIEISTVSFTFSSSNLLSNQYISSFMAKPNEEFLLWSSNTTGNPTGLINTVFDFTKPTGNNDKWNPDGWTCTLGRNVSGKALRLDVSNSTVGPVGFYFPGTIINPLGVNSYVTAFSAGISDDFYLNGSPIPSTNLGDSVSFNYTFQLGANDSFNYAFYNNSQGFVGGGVLFYINPISGEFLYPNLTAYSLIGRYRGNTAPGFTGDIIVTPFIPACNTGYVPPTGYIPPAPSPIINSGQLFLSITNTGSPCSEGIINKITEFKIDSYYPKDKELFLGFDLNESNTSFSKYLSYTNDEDYILNYTGYVLNSGVTPTTNITGYIPIYQYFSGNVAYPVIGTDSGVQICYDYRATGSGIIGSGTGILGRYFGQALTGLIANNSGYIQYDTYYFQSGTGVITDRISGFDPQMNILQNNEYLTYNDDWVNNYYVNQISSLTSGQNIILPSIEAANLFNIVGSSGFSITVSKSPKYNPNDTYIRKNSTTIKLIEDSGYRYNTFSAPLAAWASYSVGSGMNSRNVIGYAIEITNDLILSGQEIINTGILRSVPPTIFSTGTDIRTEYIGYCITSDSLECEDKEINDTTVCFTGDPNSSGYNIFVSGVLQKFKNSAITEYDPPGLQSIQTGIIPSYFNLWSGQIEYNTFVSGDKIIFNLYPFDYTGLYKQYFSVNPIHQSTGLTLTYPTDFTNISGLVSGLNTKLSNFKYPLWYPYECVSGSGLQGIYASGTGLLRASVRQLNTGDINYNNIVDFYSLRNNTGYDINLNLASREISKQISNDRLKYLLPSYVSLQGSNNNSTWTTLDVRSDINWTGIKPTQKTVTGIKSGIPQNLNIVDIEDPFEEQIDVNETGIEGGYQNLYSFIQSGQLKFGENCPPTVFSREVSIIKPTGFPPDTFFDPKTCAPTGKEDGSKEEKDKNSNGGSGTSGNPAYVLNYLRTGWVIDSGVAGQPITGINYNYYRVYLSGFSGLDYNYETLTNTFIVNNINLYSSLTGQISVHTGDNLCTIGSDYSCQVQGFIPVNITGYLTGNIRTQDNGVRCYDAAAILGSISGLNSGDYIKFNNESGRLISSSGTGYLTDCITGTGCFTTGIVDWFYNTGTNAVTFESGFNTCISGSGQFSGEYIRLKPAFVNQQLAFGGFLNGIFNVSITTGVQFTGLSMVDLLTSGLTGVYNYTGISGGYAALGYYQLNTGVISTLNNNSVDYLAGGVTGYVNSKATLLYNNPEEFDWISINNVSISYNSDSGTWIAPNYYGTSGQLLDIINQNPATFLTSGQVVGGNILLNSLLSGKTGNSILLDWGRGTNTGNQTPYFINDNLTGGRDLYRQISGTGLYSGNLSLLLFNTGYYSLTGVTGVVTGFIPTFQGVRNFTGIWGLSTGNFYTGYNNFLIDNLIVNNNYYNSIGGLNYAVSPQNIDVGLLYNDLFDTRLNGDIVKLTFSGSGISGISTIITGIYSTII